jgi:hypothetical protein
MLPDGRLIVAPTSFYVLMDLQEQHFLGCSIETCLKLGGRAGECLLSPAKILNCEIQRN